LNMSENIWGATGARKFIPYSFAEDDRNRLISIIKKHDSSNPDGFIADLEFALGKFQSSKQLAEDSSPSAVRKNLKSVHKAAKKLLKQVWELDGNSKLFLKESGGRPDIWMSINIAIYNLKRARQLAKEKSPGESSGRLRESHREWLVLDVADVVKEHLNIDAMNDPSRSFMSVLVVVYRFATGKDHQTIDRIAKKALRQRKKMKQSSPGELDEYFPKDTG